MSMPAKTGYGAEPAKTASAVSIACPVLDTGSPACLSRRASWTLWDKLGVSPQQGVSVEFLAPRVAEAQGVTCLERRDGAESKGCGHAAPLSEPVKGKPSPGAAAPAGCAPRRACRAASASPGPPRPQGSRRRRWAPGWRPVRRPGGRPSRPVAEPPLHQLTRCRPTESTSVHAGEDRQRPVPGCLSREPRGPNSVSVAVSGSNSAAISRSTSSSRLRRGRARPIAYCQCRRRHRAPP